MELYGHVTTYFLSAREKRPKKIKHRKILSLTPHVSYGSLVDIKPRIFGVRLSAENGHRVANCPHAKNGASSPGAPSDNDPMSVYL